MAALPIMSTHKAFRCKRFIAGAIVCASLVFCRPAQKWYLFRSSVQRHQVSTIYCHIGGVRCRWRDIIRTICQSAITVAAVVAL
jgi:hypothetical protein